MHPPGARLLVLTLMLALLLPVLTAAPASAGGRYECRGRDGTLIGTPPSTSEAKAWEERDGGIQCFRNGTPIQSNRDAFLDQQRAQRQHEQSLRWEAQPPVGGWDAPLPPTRQIPRESGSQAASRACAQKFASSTRVLATWRGLRGDWTVILTDGRAEFECRADDWGRVGAITRR